MAHLVNDWIAALRTRIPTWSPIKITSSAQTIVLDKDNAITRHDIKGIDLTFADVVARDVEPKNKAIWTAATAPEGALGVNESTIKKYAAENVEKFNMLWMENHNHYLGNHSRSSTEELSEHGFAKLSVLGTTQGRGTLELAEVSVGGETVPRYPDGHTVTATQGNLVAQTFIDIGVNPNVSHRWDLVEDVPLDEITTAQVSENNQETEPNRSFLYNTPGMDGIRGDMEPYAPKISDVQAEAFYPAEGPGSPEGDAFEVKTYEGYGKTFAASMQAYRIAGWTQEDLGQYAIFPKGGEFYGQIGASHIIPHPEFVNDDFDDYRFYARKYGRTVDSYSPVGYVANPDVAGGASWLGYVMWVSRAAKELSAGTKLFPFVSPQYSNLVVGLYWAAQARHREDMLADMVFRSSFANGIILWGTPLIHAANPLTFNEVTTWDPPMGQPMVTTESLYTPSAETLTVQVDAIAAENISLTASEATIGPLIIKINAVLDVGNVAIAEDNGSGQLRIKTRSLTAHNKIVVSGTAAAVGNLVFAPKDNMILRSDVISSSFTNTGTTNLTIIVDDLPQEVVTFSSQATVGDIVTTINAVLSGNGDAIAEEMDNGQFRIKCVNETEHRGLRVAGTSVNTTLTFISNFHKVNTDSWRIEAPFEIERDAGGVRKQFVNNDFFAIYSYSSPNVTFQSIDQTLGVSPWGGGRDSDKFTMDETELATYVSNPNFAVQGVIEGMAYIKAFEPWFRFGTIIHGSSARHVFEAIDPGVLALQLGKYILVISYDPKIAQSRSVHGATAADTSWSFTDFNDTPGFTVTVPATGTLTSWLLEV